MKNYILLFIIFVGPFTLKAQVKEDVDSLLTLYDIPKPKETVLKIHETIIYPKRVSYGVDISNGMTFVDRQASSNHLNNNQTVNYSGGYFNQMSLSFIIQSKIKNYGGDNKNSKSIWSISHKYHQVNTQFYDIYDGGQKYRLEDSSERYSSVSIGYLRQFPLLKVMNRHLFLGVGAELNYYYKQKIILEGMEHTSEISNTGSAINNNYGINSSPTLVIDLGTNFNIIQNSELKVHFSYHKDLNYFIGSSIPMFSTLAVKIQWSKIRWK
ncbi:hypothetical protein K4L44_17660 [Halosquirtibacter laminarini]|uniref:Uncharacterized protein n=1 Tax=Halosquirtibacter laminarini TaxID=3374600 RepID=A0AC61NN37_9BACT|nr:hypothetical protein K4L44_17660 [Prolixibacteraceae bacterium]